jgi:hypothetical protein
MVLTETLLVISRDANELLSFIATGASVASVGFELCSVDSSAAR